MFCTNCGEKLIATEQKFCHNCGTKLIATSKVIYHKTERIQNVSAPKIQYVPIKPQKQLKKGPPGNYSKLCFGLSLVSIVIGIVSLIIGFNYYRFVYWSYYSIGRLVFVIVILLLRGGGLSLGVLSKISSSKAEKLEPYMISRKLEAFLGFLGL